MPHTQLAPSDNLAKQLLLLYLTKLKVGKWDSFQAPVAFSVVELEFKWSCICL